MQNKILYKQTPEFSVVHAQISKKRRQKNGIEHRSQNGYHGRV